MPDLLDASVWLPLSAPDHMHYARARKYWDDESSDRDFQKYPDLDLLHLTV